MTISHRQMPTLRDDDEEANVPEEEDHSSQDDVASRIQQEDATHLRDYAPNSFRLPRNRSRITVTPGFSKSPSSRMSASIAERRGNTGDMESHLRAIHI